ncbi:MULTISPECIES: hypothetical protein [unclassified Streptomyces]|uniref:hypothetical protein n=2 Tax=Streptomyces TaxID=1883 RepID=UPI002E18BFE4|nr:MULTISPECIES: hypothetical protein [unclassified Streptomyces]
MPPPSGFGWRQVWLTVTAETTDEAALRGRCTSRPWTVHGLGTQSEDSRTARLRIEVWVNGARRGACAEAQRQFEELLADRPAVRVVQAALAPKRTWEAVSTWHMSREPAWHANAATRWIKDAWIHSGGADERRMVHLQGEGAPEQAEALLQLDSGGGVPFVPGMHHARRAMGAAAPPLNTERDVRARRSAMNWALAAGYLAFLAYGWTAHILPRRWQVVVAVPLIAAAWLLGSRATGNAERPWTVRFGAGAMLVFGLAGSGYMINTAEPRGLNMGLLLAIMITGLLAFGVWGSWYACKFSRIARNAVALSPVLVLPLPWVIPFVAQIMQSVYLSVFGIPTSAVNVDPVYTYFIALKPVAVGAGALLFSLGLAGLARYLYWPVGQKVTSLALVACVAGTYVVTTLNTAVQHVGAAAMRAAQSASEGRDPAGFFGIDGQLLCVSAVVDRPAMENGPLPTGHRVLVFDRAGDDLWLWDPGRAALPRGPRPALHAKAEHVSTWTPTGDRGCKRTNGR